MRILFKLVLAAVAIAALMPIVGPDTAVGKFVRTAMDDLSGFCDRQPGACADGAVIIRDAGSTLARTIADLRSDAGLTDSDRALAAGTTQIPPVNYGAETNEAFAGHNGTIHY